MVSASLVGSATIVLAILLPILDTFAVGLRFYLRLCGGRRKQGLGADDWTILAALIVSWGLVANTYAVANIAGINTTDLNPNYAQFVFGRASWASWLILLAALFLIKVSALLFYCRIFSTQDTRPFRVLAYSLIGVLAVYTILGIVIGVFVTTPVSGLWYDPTPHYNVNPANFYLGFSGINIGFDIIVIVLPLPLIGRLQINNPNRKAHVFAIFLIAALCIVASVLRFYFSYASDKLAFSESAESRFAYVAKAFLWVQIEPLVSIIAVCLPTYGSLYQKLYGRKYGSALRTPFSGKSTGNVYAERIPSGDISGSRRSESPDFGFKPTGSTYNHVELESQHPLTQHTDANTYSSDVFTGSHVETHQGIRVTRDITVHDSKAQLQRH